MKVNLGDKVRDTISGLVGIAASRSEYLYGCVRVGVAPTQLKSDGGLMDTAYLDEGQLEIVELATVRALSLAADAAAPGGPRDAPRRAADPTR